MNWDRVEGNWTELKGKVQQKWGKALKTGLREIGERLTGSGS